MPTSTIYVGDCRDVLARLGDNSVDAIVTDPPYGLSKEPDMAEVLRHWMAGDDYKHSGNGFMGKSWDSFVPGPAVWRECLRVLKPGGHMLAFFGSRTYDLGVLAIRLAGFDIRDQIMWIYGSGFPKSLDVSKAIDKAAGVERDVVGIDPTRYARLKNQIAGSISTDGEWAHGKRDVNITAPATEAACQWQGWGTALKPAHEPIVVARKPLEGTVAANVLKWGAGAVNVDGCRVGTEGTRRTCNGIGKSSSFDMAASGVARVNGSDAGRWPANVIHDGSDEVLAGFPGDGDGSAARFFYCAKASKKDRDEGLEGFSAVAATVRNHFSGLPDKRMDHQQSRNPSRNIHPTVKPNDLMRYLCRLVTPPGGTVLDPFMGSGSTGKAAICEGFSFVGVEMSEEYAEIARARIDHAEQQQQEKEVAECRHEMQLSIF